jgi:hypothetical protein
LLKSSLCWRQHAKLEASNVIFFQNSTVS